MRNQPAAHALERKLATLGSARLVNLNGEKPMWNLSRAGVTISWLICGIAHADTTTNDQVFANAALRSLHNLASASSNMAQANKDSDNLGCQYATKDIEESAHEALDNIHKISFTPIDTIENVSTLLRLDHLAPSNGCSFDLDTNLQLLIAGQAIMSLRWDYAIGDENWFVAQASGEIEEKNPLRYAQSLREQNYSWVSTRPKEMMYVVETDWKSEMKSHEVDDPSIANSGDNLKIIEVDYRKKPGDNNSEVYFYRTKDGAIMALQAEKKQAEDAAIADANQKAADTEWDEKLLSLRYMIANRDAGFKLIYAVCKLSSKSIADGPKCDNDGSHDWSDDHRLQYRWFSDIQGCEDAQNNINAQHPSGLKINADDVFTSDCVPAPKVSGRALIGYRMVIALSAPDSVLDHASYANLRLDGSPSAIVFKSFDKCYEMVGNAYSKIMKDLGVDKDGNLLGDKNKSIGLIVNCVRTY